MNFINIIRRCVSPALPISPKLEGTGSPRCRSSPDRGSAATLRGVSPVSFEHSWPKSASPRLSKKSPKNAIPRSVSPISFTSASHRTDSLKESPRRGSTRSWRQGSPKCISPVSFTLPSPKLVSPALRISSASSRRKRRGLLLSRSRVSTFTSKRASVWRHSQEPSIRSDGNSIHGSEFAEPSFIHNIWQSTHLGGGEAYFSPRPPAQPMMLKIIPSLGSIEIDSKAECDADGTKEETPTTELEHEEPAEKCPAPKYQTLASLTDLCRSPESEEILCKSSLSCDRRRNVATQALRRNTRSEDGGQGHKPLAAAEWMGGVRALRDSHVRLVLRQLRHIERLNHAIDRAAPDHRGAPALVL